MAASLANTLVQKGVLSRNWNEELDVLEDEKERLLKDEFDSIMDKDAKQFIIDTGTDDFKYSSCEKLFHLLANGEDGKKKSFFTRRFQSPLVNRWMALLSMYRDKKLFIAETVRDLRQAAAEINALRKRINELGLKLSEIERKKEMVVSDISEMQAKLTALLNEFDSEISDEIEQKLRLHAIQLEAQARTAATSPEFVSIWEQYVGEFLQNQCKDIPASMDEILEIAEELCSYLSLANKAILPRAVTVRDLAKSALAYSPAEEARKAAEEIRRLKRSCEHNRDLARLEEIEKNVRDEISKSELSITEVTEKKRELIARLSDELKQASLDPIDFIES
jgi:phage shock protein A